MRHPSRARLALFAGLALVAAPHARADGPAVGVIVPIRDGEARRPEPVVGVPLDGRKEEPLPAPILIPDGGTAGTTTVRPELGGGYTVESPGKTTTVRRLFGGGYTIEENGRTTTVVRPQFGGGYQVETTPASPPLVLPPPQR